MKKLPIYTFIIFLVLGQSSFALTPAPKAKLWNEMPTLKGKNRKRVPNFRYLNKKSRRAVVNIFTTHPFMEDDSTNRIGSREEENIIEKFFEPPLSFNQKRQSLGSGFIINEQGYILTNAHLVDKAISISAFVGPKSEIYRVKLVGVDALTDIALLKLDSDKTFPFLYLGNSKAIEAGEWVMAIGNPFGFTHSVTQGIISAKSRNLTNERLKIGSMDFIQTDASINPGNSGGPLLNWRGEVIGINTAISTSSLGIGFAVPINVAKSILAQLKLKGKVSRGYFGVIVQSLSLLLAEGLGINAKEGVLVVDVVRGSSAAESGIKKDDIIIGLWGRKVSNAKTFYKTISKIPVGKAFKVKLLRKGTLIELTTKLTELITEEEPSKKPEKQKVNFDKLGLKVENTLPYGSGVTISSLNPEGLAFTNGFSYEDIIFEISIKKPKNTKVEKFKIKNEKDYNKAIEDISKGDILTFLTNRFGSPQYLALKY